METLTLSPSQSGISIKRRVQPFKGPTCAALADGNGAQAAALAAFATLNTDSGNATSIINQNQLGPYGADGSCGYDCSYEQTWWWKADYRPTNSNLNSAVAFINCGNTYNNAFQPTQIWVGTDLPNFSTVLLADINAQNFDAANTVLQNNINEANQGLQTIASFTNYENQFVGYLQTTATNAHTWIVNNATNIENNLIGQIACGSGDVQNTFNGMFNDVSAKFVTIAVPFNIVNTDFQAALQKVELVAGIFLSLQSKSQLVGENITKAQSYPPNSPLRQVYMNIAIENWNDFVTEANAQFVP